MPPNCFLEVEDVSREWTWKHKFDLIHMRLLLGAFTDSEWAAVYKRCYELEQTTPRSQNPLVHQN